MLTFLLVLFILLSTLNLSTLFGDSTFVGGVPLMTWISYVLYILLIVLSIYFNLSKYWVEPRKYDVIQLVLLFTGLLSVAYSLLIGISWRTVLFGSIHYFLPFLLSGPIFYVSDRSIVVLKRTIHISIILCGVIALLFFTGILNLIATSDISRLYRSSTIIDGGLGLVGVALALQYILNGNEKYGKLRYVLLIAGVLIVASGMSRARIVALFLIVILSLLFHMAWSESKIGRFYKILVFVAIAAFVVMLLFPGFFSSFYNTVFSRFESLGNDNSTIFRVEERRLQLDYFMKNPIFGVGWGGLSNATVTDLRGVAQKIANHNMFTSVLAGGGLIFAIPYFLWLGSMLFNESRQLKEDPYARTNVLLLLSILIMSWGSAGFAKYSMVIAMMIVYINMRERRENADAGKQNDWDPDLPQAD